MVLKDILVVIAYLVLGCTLLLSIFTYRLRNYTPIKVRRFWLLILSGDSMLYTCCFFVISGVNEVTCGLTISIMALFTALIVPSVTFRLALIAIESIISSYKVKLISYESLNEQQLWLLMHRKHFNRYITIFLLLFLVCLLTPNAFILSNAEYWEVFSTHPVCQKAYSYYIDSTSVIVMIALIPIVISLKYLFRAVDTFGIKTEFAIIICFSAWSSIVGFLISFLNFNSLQQELEFRILTSTLPVLISTFYASKVYPLLRVYNRDALGRKLTIQQDLSKSQFIAYLNTKTGYEAFKNFLISEYSVENILFYKAAQDYEAQFGNDQDMDLKNAIRIRDSFIQEDSPLSINISFRIRRDILESFLTIETLTTSIFKEAVNEVLDLMFTDSKTRFMLANKAMVSTITSKLDHKETSRLSYSYSANIIYDLEK